MSMSMFARRVPKMVPSSMLGSVRTKVSSSTAVWNGTLKEGSGTLSTGTKAFVGIPYSHPARFGDDVSKTNPEEMIGAAHAGCYSMFLSALITKEGLNPASVETVATVTLGEGPTITGIHLKNETKCEGLSQEKFNEVMQAAKEKCPISKALASVESITLEAKLV